MKINDPRNADYLGAANRRLRHQKYLLEEDALWEDAWREIRFDRYNDPARDWARDVGLWDRGTFYDAYRLTRREADLPSSLEEADKMQRSPPGHGEARGQIESSANLLAKEHSCALCEQSPVGQALRSWGKMYKLCDNFAELRERSKTCKLYETVLSSTEQYDCSELGEIYVFSKPLSLSVSKEPALRRASTRLRRILGSPGTWARTDSTVPSLFLELQCPSGATNNLVARNQIPILPEAGSEFDFALYREWLRKCDRCHKHTDSHLAALPTRVIDVGDGNDLEYVRLRITNGKSRGMYIALSHRWGKNTPETTTANLDDRRKAIKVDSLPKSFRDVIRITQRLGLRFLWIDSLCIIQNSSLDWSHESRKMDRVFASAYCTIAFHPTSKVCGSFQQDVENGELSRRGWILQERALSRRTIHLVGEQAYWECGSAIWSKTADKGARPRGLLASSEFPKQLELQANAPNDGSAMFQHIFAQYSGLGLTQLADRPIAIAGLEYRLEAFYETISVYGIIKSFFGKSLLWQRSADEWMEPLLNFNSNLFSWSIKGSRVPSWSWMAYAGKIRYRNIFTGGLTWMTDFKFDYMMSPHSRCILVAPMTRISATCRIQLTKWEVTAENGDLVGWTRYDCRDEGNVTCRTCIRLAEGTRGWKEYAYVSHDVELPAGNFSYVLLLREVEGDTYRRIGVAIISKPKRLVAKFAQDQSIGARAVIGANRTVAGTTAEAEILHRGVASSEVKTSVADPPDESMVCILKSRQGGEDQAVLRATVAPGGFGGFRVEI
ncbi:hypothetical protein DL769_009003 [Monosporascus sp. CRB-8-3]|nr:hypothetical protein DL769_009003 [Monosporascus sp. CRB-8-3]